MARFAVFFNNRRPAGGNETPLPLSGWHMGPEEKPGPGWRMPCKQLIQLGIIDGQFSSCWCHPACRQGLPRTLWMWAMARLSGFAGSQEHAEQGFGSAIELLPTPVHDSHRRRKK